jgi:hypothetical protein
VEEPERRSLARKVRACATAATDEAEFVRRFRRTGAMIKPRYAAGRDDVIVGYSVAERPPKGVRPVWFGGGHLAKDLTLPRLRGAWVDSPDKATAAVAEWGAAARGRRPVAVGAEAHEPDPQLWAHYSDEVARLRETLRTVPFDDHGTWAQVARETSGAFAAWSTATEPTPGPLAAAADELSKTAQLRRYPARPVRTVGPSAKGASLMLMAATMGGTGTAAEAIMLRQLLNVAKAVHDMHKASNDLRRARQISHMVKHQLSQVAAALPSIPAAPAPVDAEASAAVRASAAGQVPGRAPGPVLPPTYEQARTHATTPGGTTRPGIER